MAAFIQAHITVENAAKKKERRYFMSEMHHRVKSEARNYRMSDDSIKIMQEAAREKARTVWDSVHLHG